MTRYIPKFIGTSLVGGMVLLVVGLAWWINSNDYTIDLVKSDPAVILTTIQPQFNSAATQSLMIDQTGGVITSQVATITLPEDALASATTVTVTPITELIGLPAAVQLLVGADISPDGLTLLKTGQLEFAVDTTAFKPTEQTVVGFSYAGSGEQFHLVPTIKTGTGYQINLTGFSGYGLLVIPAYVEIDTNSTTAADVAVEQLGLWSVGRPLTDAQPADLLRTWYQTGLKPLLQQANQDDAQFEAALHEYLSWMMFLTEVYNTESDLTSEINEAKLLVEQAFDFAVTQANRRCQEDQDVNQVAKLFWLAQVAKTIGVGDPQAIILQSLDCVGFELTITSTVQETGAEQTGAAGASVAAVIPIHFDQTKFLLSGSAEAVELNPVFGDDPCTTSSPVNYTITVEPTKFDIQPDTALNIELPLFISHDDSITYDCSTADVGFKDAGTQYWVEAFDVAHQTEMTGYDEAGIHYLITDWESVNVGGVVARKQYSGTNHGVAENTIFELRHRPKN